MQKNPFSVSHTQERKPHLFDLLFLSSTFVSLWHMFPHSLLAQKHFEFFFVICSFSVWHCRPSDLNTSVTPDIMMFVLWFWDVHKLQRPDGKGECVTVESNGMCSEWLMCCCALTGPPLDRWLISSNVSCSMGHCHLITDLIF